MNWQGLIPSRPAVFQAFACFKAPETCVCVFHIDSSPYRFVGLFVEFVIYCIKVVSLTSVSDIMDSLLLSNAPCFADKNPQFYECVPF